MSVAARGGYCHRHREKKSPMGLYQNHRNQIEGIKNCEGEGLMAPWPEQIDSGESRVSKLGILLANFILHDF